MSGNRGESRIVNMEGKVCLVTGATSGIGRETVTALADMGATVIVHGRNEEKIKRVVKELNNGRGEAEGILADFSRMGDVRSMADELHQRFDRLDVLVNNAGVALRDRKVTEDGNEMTFQVDYLSHFLLTNLLLDIMKDSAPSRIINVSSGIHYLGKIHFEDMQTSGRYSWFRSYSQAKLAQILFTYELVRRLGPVGVTVNVPSPGLVDTNFGKNEGWLLELIRIMAHGFGKSPREGADAVIFLSSSGEVENVTGRYFENRRQARSSNQSYDPSSAKILWEISDELVRSGTRVGSSVAKVEAIIR